MKSIAEINKEGQEKLSALMKECRVFFAFGDQFERNKTPLNEGERYVSVGYGGYMPNTCVKAFIEGQKQIEKWKKSERKKLKDGKEQHILYELQNYECFYSGDIEDAMPVLPYPRKDVWKVYLANKERCQQF